MGETHVVTALKAKRAEISGYVHDLERNWPAKGESLAAIDATIRVFSPFSRSHPFYAHFSAHAVITIWRPWRRWRQSSAGAGPSLHEIFVRA